MPAASGALWARCGSWAGRGVELGATGPRGWLWGGAGDHPTCSQHEPVLPGVEQRWWPSRTCCADGGSSRCACPSSSPPPKHQGRRTGSRQPWAGLYARAPDEVPGKRVLGNLHGFQFSWFQSILTLQFFLLFFPSFPMNFVPECKCPGRGSKQQA